jgi:hypothetical protein
MIRHGNKKFNDPYPTDSIQKGEKKSGTQKRKKKPLGCVECSTNGDSMGENKISSPSFSISLCKRWLIN